MPDGLVALAASDGVVWSAMQTPRGFAVVIDHGPTKVATFYTHLEQLLVTPTANAKAGQRVRAGQPIGIIGADPLDGEHLKHLHFELWLGGPSDADRSGAGDARAGTSSPIPNALVARNAGFVYRPIGASGEAYPDWIRALKGQGRRLRHPRRDTREIVYVGSSAGRLYDTLTRHFQTWRRWKGFWRGQYGEGHDPGLTYPATPSRSPFASRRRASRSTRRCGSSRALKPRDNLIGQPEPRRRNRFRSEPDQEEHAMDDISLALNPPRFVKHPPPPIRLVAELVTRVAARGDQRPRAGRARPRGSKLRGVELAYPRIGVTRRELELPDRHAERHRDAPPARDDAGARGRRRRDHVRRSARPRLRDHHQPRRRLGVALREPRSPRRDPHRPLPRRASSTSAPATRSATSARPSPVRSSGSTSSCGSATASRLRARRSAPAPRRAGSCVQHYDAFTPAPPTAQKEAA